MNVDFNPWDSFGKGMQIGNAFFENADLARKQMIAEKERAALSQMGQGDQLMGHEDNPMAVRPDSLKALYRDHPEAAWKAEQYIAAPFTEQRKAKQAEASQLAMLQAKGNAFAQAVREMEGEGEGPPAQPATAQPVNAFATQMHGEPSSVGLISEGGMAAPDGAQLANPAGRGSTTDLLSGKNLSNASGMKKIYRNSFEHGPSVEYQRMSPLEVEQMRTEAAQKGRQMELNAQKTADDLRVSADTSRKQADEQVYGLQRELTEVKKAMTGPGIMPRDAVARINELNGELKAAKARRDSLYFGKDAPAPESAQLTPQEKAQAAAVRAGKGQSARPSPLAASPLADNAPESIGDGLPYQQQVALRQDKLKGDLAQTQKMLSDAKDDHAKLINHKDMVDKIIGLAKEGIGSSTMGQLPFGIGEPLQRAWSSRNDLLQSLRGPAIQLFMNGNNSKMMDTPKEVERITGGIPDVGRHEDVNKQNAAMMGNNYYSSIQKTPAMEWWAHNKKTMDGFSEAWADWKTHNPQFTIRVENGQTHLEDAPHVMAPTKWMQLRKKYSPEQIKTLQEKGLDFTP